MAEQAKVVHTREPNWALLVPIFYAPLFPLMRIALKGNPRLPQYYAGALGAALTHAAYMMFKDSTVGASWASPRSRRRRPTRRLW